VNPGEVLAARADRTSREEPERQQHPRQRAAVGGKHDAGAEQGHARAVAFRALGFLLPPPADLSEEAGDGWRLLVHE
jgi:hypothetical protein